MQTKYKIMTLLIGLGVQLSAATISGPLEVVDASGNGISSDSPSDVLRLSGGTANNGAVLLLGGQNHSTLANSGVARIGWTDIWKYTTEGLIVNSGLKMSADVVQATSNGFVRLKSRVVLDDPGTDGLSGAGNTSLIRLSGGSPNSGAVLLLGGPNHTSLGNAGIGRIGWDEIWRYDQNGMKLAVGKVFRSEKIVTSSLKVDAAWTSAMPADYVFEDSYELKPLKDVESFVREHKHLPGVPSAKKQIEDGIDVYVMMNKHLEKIEELTLYAIDADKQIQELAGDNAALKAGNKTLLRQNQQMQRQMDQILKRLSKLEAGQVD